MENTKPVMPAKAGMTVLMKGLCLIS